MRLHGRRDEHEVGRGFHQPAREEGLDLGEPRAGGAIGNPALVHRPSTEGKEGAARLFDPLGGDPLAACLVLRSRRSVRDENDVQPGALIEEVRERPAAAEDLVVRVGCEDDHALRRKAGNRVGNEGPLVWKVREPHPGSLPPTMRSVVDPADTPRVSVVLRTKDRPGFLAEATASLRGQTFTDFETILVNDGAPIAAPLLHDFPGRALRAVTPPAPGGRTRALNAGLAAARGTYVAYLDDDDLYLPSHLETLVRFLDGSDEYEAAYTSVRQIEQVLGDDGRYRDGKELAVYGRPFDAARLLYKNDIPLIGLAHRRALANEIGGFDETFDQFEDWDFLIRLSAKTRFRHLPAVTAVYRLRDDASNITAAQPWHSGDAQTARRRLFEKHADRRSASTELALVDSLETDLYALRDAALASRAEAEALRQSLAEARAEARAAGDAAALREADLRASRDYATRQGEESATREQALAVENVRLKAEAARLFATVDAMNRSLVWRLFTPWWKLKELLKR